MGRLLGGSGVFPNEVFAVWRQLPGVLITVMSASLLLGERLPSLRRRYDFEWVVNRRAVEGLGGIAIDGETRETDYAVAEPA
jgi:hypothetical protein